MPRRFDSHLTRPLRPIVPAIPFSDQQHIGLPSRSNARDTPPAPQAKSHQKANPKRAPRTRSLSDEKWKEVAGKINELYIGEQYPLRVLAEIMETLYHFRAT